MAPKHVYGKRSRAIYDPLAAFASPQRSPDSYTDDRHERTAKPVKDKEPSVENSEKAKKAIGERKALGEINVNAVVEPVNPFNAGSQNKNKPSHRRKRPVTGGQEKQDEHEPKIIEVSDMKAQLGSNRGKAKEIPQKVSVEYAPFEFDEVPLFCDGHGYDSDEDTREAVRSPVAEDHHTPTIVGNVHLHPPGDTPTIDVLPPTPPPPDDYGEHCAELLELSSHQITSFSEWSNDLSSHFSITKIAEASFGEVYRLSLLSEISGLNSDDESVFKIIALKPPDKKLPTDKHKLAAAMKKNEGMSKPLDVANEIRLLQRMCGVPGFTNFREVRVLKGRPPALFAKAYKNFNTAQKAKKKELSIFPDPSKKTSYVDDQLWAVIEMQDAGTDLEILIENGHLTSIWQVWDAFWQVAISLGKGEEEAEFEHRDLHLGNICIRQPSEPKNETTRHDVKRKLNFTGLETTIIDYTISRALVCDGSPTCKDLSLEPSLFEGDSTEEYQYDIYRYMRSALFLDDPLADFPDHMPAAAQERSWDQYHPATNLVWLHFILYKVLEQLAWPSAMKAPPRRNHDAHAEWKRANDLEHILSRVSQILDPGCLFDNELRSAADLVHHAISEGWLDYDDVVDSGKWDEEDVEAALAAQFDELGIEARADEVEEAEAPRRKTTRQKNG